MARKKKMMPTDEKPMKGKMPMMPKKKGKGISDKAMLMKAKA